MDNIILKGIFNKRIGIPNRRNEEFMSINNSFILIKIIFEKLF